MFDLDFRAPQAKPSAKADIMSLFSTTSSAPPPVAAHSGGSFFGSGAESTGLQGQNGFGSWNGGITSSAPPAQFGATQSPVTSAGWGMPDQSAWGSTATAPVSLHFSDSTQQ